jgi:hypothetical protein
MIKKIDERLKKWAVWFSSPNRVITGTLGKSVEARIMEGKGKMLPSGTLRGTMIPVWIGTQASDLECARTHRAIRKLGAKKQRFVRVVYLGRGTAEARAKGAKLSKKNYYRKIDLLHSDLDEILTR